MAGQSQARRTPVPRHADLLRRDWGMFGISENRQKELLEIRGSLIRQEQSASGVPSANILWLGIVKKIINSASLVSLST